MASKSEDVRDFARAATVAGLGSVLLGLLYVALYLAELQLALRAMGLVNLALGALLIALSQAVRVRATRSLIRLTLFGCFALGLFQVTPLGSWILLGTPTDATGSYGATTMLVFAGSHLVVIVASGLAFAVGLRPRF